MPDNQKVIFAAEFDAAGVSKGTDEIVAKLSEAREAEAQLKQMVVDYTQALKDNGKQQEAIQKQIKGTVQDSKVAVQTIKDLNKQLQDLRDKSVAIDKGLNSTKTELRGVTAEVKNYSQAVETNAKAVVASNKTHVEAHKEHDHLIGSLQKLTSGNYLAAEAVGLVRRHMVDAAFAIAGGFVGAITGLALPALEKMANALVEGDEGLKKLANQQKLINETFDEAAKNVGKDVAQLEIFKQKLNDTSLSESDRLKVAKEYNKVADEQNKIDLKQIDNLQLINEKIEAQTNLIIARSVAVAATAKLGGYADKFVDAQLKVQQAINESTATGKSDVEKEKNYLEMADKFKKKRDALLNEGQSVGSIAKKTRYSIEQDQDALDATIKRSLGSTGLLIYDLIEERNKASEELARAGKVLGGLITVPGITTKPPKGPTIENVFLQKLSELKERLAASMAAQFQSDDLIKSKFALQIDKEFTEIGKLVKDKKLTGPQGDILKALIKQINDVDLSKALDEFHQKQREALKKVDEAIAQAFIEDASKTVANIRNEFEREAAGINQGYDATVKTLNQKMLDMVKDIDLQVKNGLITKDQAKQRKLILGAIFGDLLTQAGIDKTNKELDLAFKTFQDTINKMKLSFNADALELSEETTQKIHQQTRLFLDGSIKYEAYQKNLTNILFKESRERKKRQLQELNDELDALNARIAATTDPGQKKQLEEQQKAVRSQISTLSREIDADNAKHEDEAQKKRIENITKYAQSIQSVLQQIGSFYQQALAVEQAHVERSIALQQRRVDNARDIADKGNAEYLEIEQKRLDELDRKREENARKQLAINNALALSNATVAAITAIAQAVQTGSPFAALAALAAVIGAIGAAYAFANSLQPVSANFYEGEEYIKGTGKPRGKDTVPANLTIGERVVTADKNAQYWDALHAIHTGKVPATVLNEFVNAYPTNTATIDFDKLALATNNRLGFDSVELSHELKTTNEKLDEVIDAVSSIGFKINMDERGFAAALDTYTKKQRIRKKA